MFSVDQVIVWIVVGLLGGGIAGALMTWERGGFGLWKNLALGLTGAIIGGLLFRIFGIWPGLDKIAISLRDIVSAVVGSLLVLGALWLWRRFGASQEKTRFLFSARDLARIDHLLTRLARTVTMSCFGGVTKRLKTGVSQPSHEAARTCASAGAAAWLA